MSKKAVKEFRDYVESHEYFEYDARKLFNELNKIDNRLFTLGHDVDLVICIHDQDNVVRKFSIGTLVLEEVINIFNNIGCPIKRVKCMLPIFDGESAHALFIGNGKILLVKVFNCSSEDK